MVILVALIGAVMGSFPNLVIDRVPRPTGRAPRRRDRLLTMELSTKETKPWA